MIKAIVVGITRYPSLEAGILQDADVRGAVEDALSFRDWLVRDRGLAESEVSLHLSPAGAHPGVKPATRAEIRRAIRDLRASTNEDGARFFFFSGHGFSFQVNLNGALEDVIACEDFTSPTDMEPALLTADILDYLLRMGRRDVYFFFDCCRNSVAGARLGGGQLGLNEKPDPTLSDSSQLALFAARPGTTTEAPSDFTRALLAGLRGTGSARVWSRGSLVVTFESLAQYVQPRLRSEATMFRRGPSQGLLLTVYSPAPGLLPPRESCEIVVEKVRPTDSLVARAFLDGDAIGSQDLPGGRGTLQLPPRTYLVALDSPEGAYAVDPSSSIVDFLEPKPLTAEATPRPRPAVPPLFSFVTGPASGDAPEVRSGLEVLTGKSLPRKPRSGHLSAAVPRGATARVIGADGEPRGPAVDGPDALDVRLPAGSYTIHLSQAGRLVRAVPLALRPGDEPRLDLAPPPSDPLREALVLCTGGSQFLPSEELGPIVDPRLSLWLAAMAAKAASGRPHGPFAASPVPPPAAASGSLFVLVATEDPARARLWTSTGDLGLSMAPTPGLPGLHHGVSAGPPGVHVLGWESAAGRFSMAVPLLADRVTSVVIVDTKGEPRSAQIFLVAHRDREDALPPDERPRTSQVIAARSLVNAQEAFLRGEPPAPLEADTFDPVWTLLDACAAVREADLPRARARLDQLGARWPGLPDLPILKRLLGEDALPLPGVPLLADDARAVARWERSGEIPTDPTTTERGPLPSLQRALPGTVWTTWPGWPGLSRGA